MLIYQQMGIGLCKNTQKKRMETGYNTLIPALQSPAGQDTCICQWNVLPGLETQLLVITDILK